ncbi:hypothetical protein [Streptomyces sp. NPDC001389]|uniref:hypothetical protein n=1 Tax=Streptomyces sp. NPDC001389 TaxID=3364569 RepID=UPI0036BF1979
MINSIEEFNVTEQLYRPWGDVCPDFWERGGTEPNPVGQPIPEPQLTLSALSEAAAVPVPPPAAVPVPVPAPVAEAPAPPALIAPRDQHSVSPVYVPGDAVVPVEADPHDQIAVLSKAGRHQEAVALAVAAEQRAAETFGDDTFAAVHWVEVRAHLASVAADPARSCELWLQAAQTRLDALHQAPDAPDVEAAVDRAHHQWERIPDPSQAHALAPQLVAQRRRVPGRQHAALDAIQKKVERLESPLLGSDRP